MEKSNLISIGAVVIAIAGAVVANTGRDTKTLVAASASENDAEVTEILKASETVKPVNCDKQWMVKDGAMVFGWVCSDVGYDASRQALLTKRAGDKGIKIEYMPDEKADGAIGVAIRVTEGDAPAQPPMPEVNAYTEQETP